MTYFHLPRSSLLMLVCAFGGRERVLVAYELAVRKRYRFFSYGDAMFLVELMDCPVTEAAKRKTLKGESRRRRGGE